MDGDTPIPAAAGVRRQLITESTPGSDSPGAFSVVQPEFIIIAAATIIALEKAQQARIADLENRRAACRNHARTVYVAVQAKSAADARALRQLQDADDGQAESDKGDGAGEATSRSPRPHSKLTCGCSIGRLTFDTRRAVFYSIGISAHGAMSMCHDHVHVRC